MNIDIGASSSLHAHRFTLYLPDRDCLGEPVADIEKWVMEATYILCAIAGGATRVAPASGMWLNKEEGKLIVETTHILYVIYEPVQFERDFFLIRDFICRFGRETAQQSIAVELGGKMHFITDFGSSSQHPAIAIAS
jgi:hypothetical protein